MQRRRKIRWADMMTKRRWAGKVRHWTHRRCCKWHENVMLTNGLFTVRDRFLFCVEGFLIHRRTVPASPRLSSSLWRGKRWGQLRRFAPLKCLNWNGLDWIGHTFLDRRYSVRLPNGIRELKTGRQSVYSKDLCFIKSSLNVHCNKLLLLSERPANMRTAKPHNPFLDRTQNENSPWILRMAHQSLQT